MRIVMLKYKSLQARVHTHKHDAFSHTITQVGDYLHKYREESEPEIADMQHISLTTCWAQTAPVVFPHILAFIVCKTTKRGFISDACLKRANGEKELGGWLKCRVVVARLNSHGQEFHLNDFTTEQRGFSG